MTLPRRGTLSVREASGPEGAPTFVLLHGLTATADLNWFSVFEPLAEIGSVLAPDQRGHGDGIRDRHLSLETLADDVAALLDERDLASCILVGFSMGGAVSQLVWRRHRPRVRGLVLVATAARFPSGAAQRSMWAAMAAAGPLLERVRPRLEDLAVRRAQRGAAPNPRQVWAQAQLRRNEPLDLLSARRSLAGFCSMPWCRSIDVPASFVLTARDQVVPPEHQNELIAALGDCEVESIDAEHGAFIEAPELFAPAVVRAARSVAARVAR